MGHKDNTITAGVFLRSTRKSDFWRKDVAQIPTVFRRSYVAAVWVAPGGTLTFFTLKLHKNTLRSAAGKQISREGECNPRFGIYTDLFLSERPSMLRWIP